MISFCGYIIVHVLECFLYFVMPKTKISGFIHPLEKRRECQAGLELMTFGFLPDALQF